MFLLVMSSIWPFLEVTLFRSARNRFCMFIEYTMKTTNDRNNRAFYLIVKLRLKTAAPLRFES